MDACRQIKLIGCSLLVSQRQTIPVIAVVKGNLLHLQERNLPVYVYASVGDASSGIILASLHHDIVVAVLGNLKIPLNPLPRASPGIAAHIVQNRGGDTVGLSRRGRSVIFCIQGRFGTYRGILTLNHLHVICRSLGSIPGRLLCQVLFIGIQILHGGDHQLLHHNRLILRAKADPVHALLQIKAIGLCDISHIIPEPGRLPAVNLGLCRADFVALIVYPHIAAVRPYSRKGNVSRVVKGNLPVYVYGALCRHASGLGDQIFHIDIVETRLRHVDLPGHQRSGAGVQRSVNAFIILVLFGIALRSVIEEIHFHALGRTHRVRMVKEV
ncbi:hypothetical protein IMSAG185_00431 [Lachnospiraceae bacterium]|nr:hypothetical protein IMSAG185_00431 [Lachnospiraceae bacterium]